eukprot:3699566-Amphidinium_carterae.1
MVERTEVVGAQHLTVLEHRNTWYMHVVPIEMRLLNGKKVKEPILQADAVGAASQRHGATVAEAVASKWE